MRRTRTAGLTTIVLVALSAVLTLSAQATEGPFFITSGLLTRLLAGESRLIGVANPVTPYLIEVATSKIQVTCSIFTLKRGATIYGSTNAHPGTGKELMEYEGCQGGGKSCMPQSAKFSTTTLVSTLGYSSASRSAPVLMLYQPALGSTIATIKFTGAECVASSTALAGTIVARVSPEGHSSVKITVGFAKSQPTIFTEEGGSLKTVKPLLVAFGSPATLTGETKFGLTEPFGEWGVLL
jgi:hypothetical protein